MPNRVPENYATDFDFGVMIGMLIVVLLSVIILYILFYQTAWMNLA